MAVFDQAPSVERLRPPGLHLATCFARAEVQPGTADYRQLEGHVNLAFVRSAAGGWGGNLRESAHEFARQGMAQACHRTASGYSVGRHGLLRAHRPGHDASETVRLSVAAERVRGRHRAWAGCDSRCI